MRAFSRFCFVLAHAWVAAYVALTFWTAWYLSRDPRGPDFFAALDSNFTLARIPLHLLFLSPAILFNWMSEGYAAADLMRMTEGDRSFLVRAAWVGVLGWILFAGLFAMIASIVYAA